MRPSWLAPVVPALALTLAFVADSAAQVIALKTVPVAAGDQFLIVPSRNLAMGGVSIALEDPLLDPFVNPAKGRRQRGTELFVTPTLYSISQRAGAGRTLPTGLRFGSGTWFGGVATAVQQLEAPGPQVCCILPLRPGLDVIAGNPDLLSHRAHTNRYGQAVVGTRIPGTSLAIGVAGYWAELHGVDGVEHLYALSQRIDQHGYLGDLRLGLAGDLGGGRTFEALLLHSRFNVTHDVQYLDWVYDSAPPPTWKPRTRLETNFDRTNTWGVHLGYVQPIAQNGWRVGGILTTNVKSHPKIPNYEIMNIPRDPGTTWAYNFGLGLAKSGGPATFGLDLVFEPARSHTWAEAEAPIPLPDGRTLPVGYHTIDNRFRFSNATVRFGAARDVGRVGFQAGVEMRSVWYRLEQQDNVLDAYRQQTEAWVEWTPTWGASVKFPEFEVRYRGRITTGTGRPGVAWGGTATARFESAVAADVIVAPGGPLTLQEATVMTHQISIALPLR